eukprot:CAMPEP_0177694006 /NCGR_PEP_ID=MMETSP0484_2-20121128/2706_1 /TAXON_ID=354590 /ORGANISM="Rhodomonas lens, Strain RHODO" /LENGTH=104 /DNA_ID=CAMNT_0019204861 /DNA_START=261 /DNA_END=575 /DNA_ORIENTATION=+
MTPVRVGLPDTDPDGAWLWTLENPEVKGMVPSENSHRIPFVPESLALTWVVEHYSRRAVCCANSDANRAWHLVLECPKAQMMLPAFKTHGLALVICTLRQDRVV